MAFDTRKDLQVQCMKGPPRVVFLRPYAGSPYFQFLAPKSPGCRPVMACVGHPLEKMRINHMGFLGTLYTHCQLLIDSYREWTKMQHGSLLEWYLPRCPLSALSLQNPTNPSCQGGSSRSSRGIKSDSEFNNFFTFKKNNTQHIYKESLLRSITP